MTRYAQTDSCSPLCRSSPPSPAPHRGAPYHPSSPSKCFQVPCLSVMTYSHLHVAPGLLSCIFISLLQTPSSLLYRVPPKCLLQSSINIAGKKYCNLTSNYQEDNDIYHWFLTRVINLMSGDTIILFVLPVRHLSNGIIMNSGQHFLNLMACTGE